MAEKLHKHQLNWNCCHLRLNNKAAVMSAMSSKKAAICRQWKIISGLPQNNMVWVQLWHYNIITCFITLYNRSWTGAIVLLLICHFTSRLSIKIAKSVLDFWPITWSSCELQVTGWSNPAWGHGGRLPSLYEGGVTIIGGHIETPAIYTHTDKQNPISNLPRFWTVWGSWSTWEN